MNNLMAAFTEEQVENITGVTKSQLRYWDKTKFFGPTQFEKHKGARFGRVYSFRDLVSLKVLNDLRNKAKVPLQLLRELKESWADDGDEVWINQTLYAINKRVVIDTPQGFEDAQSSQGVLEIPIRAEYEKIQNHASKLFKRNKKSVGKIDRNRGIASNKPVIAGTRVPVKSIKAFADEGYSVKEILEEYPNLTQKDVRAAINY